MSTIIKGDDALLAMLPGITYVEGGVYVDRTEWIIPSAWGRDGWDLGEWPYVKYGYVDVDDKAFGYLSYCEGDVTVDVFDTREARDFELDKAALFHWLRDERQRHHMEGIARRKGKEVDTLTPDDLPPHRRGHFSWARLDREKPTVIEPGHGLPTITGHLDAVVSCSACIANGLTGCATPRPTIEVSETSDIANTEKE